MSSLEYWTDNTTKNLVIVQYFHNNKREARRSGRLTLRWIPPILGKSIEKMRCGRNWPRIAPNGRLWCCTLAFYCHSIRTKHFYYLTERDYNNMPTAYGEDRFNYENLMKQSRMLAFAVQLVITI